MFMVRLAGVFQAPWRAASFEGPQYKPTAQSLSGLSVCRWFRRLRRVKAQALKDWRKKFGYSQEDLASALMVHVLTVSRWEREAREIPPFLHLALEALGNRQKLATKKERK